MKIPQGSHDKHTNLPRPMTPEEFAKSQADKKAKGKQRKSKPPKSRSAPVDAAPGATSTFKLDRSREWKAWTDKEKDYLRRAVIQGEEMRVMRIQLKRSDERIRYQMRKLGLTK
jgi:hypothetical protein